MNSEWLKTPAAKLDEQSGKEATERQGQLTKPPGALGRLEDSAITLAAMQGKIKPTLDNIHVSVFAGDHGIAAKGVSAFPQAVTGEMVRNFANGGAAICVLAKSIGANLEVINLGTVNDPGEISGVKRQIIAASTADFSEQDAMTEEQFTAALNAGRDAAMRAKESNASLFIGGEMGIGNTSSATAIACAILDMAPAALAGPGTGLDSDGVSRKVVTLKSALELHRSTYGNAREALRCMGGFEITALCGAFITCAQERLPVLVDGFIATAAALCAAHICDNASDWFLFSHASAEPGHQSMTTSLGAKPLLDLGMRLGEGSGAAVAVPLLRLACDLHNNMATFAEAGVSEKSE